MYQLLEGDCRVMLAGVASRSVDAVITDPPYEIAFAEWDSSGIAHDRQVWREVLRVLKPGGMLLAFSGTRTYHQLAQAIADAGFEIRDMLGWIYSNGMPRGYDISQAMPEEHAGEWAGWYPTLKPCVDPICLARRPLDGQTIVENVLKWGIGAYNVSACRVDGKRPGNVLIDEGARDLYVHVADIDLTRFFYCAKTQPDERQAGCQDLGGNNHPCVKPLELMRYLCRLVTPKDGIILDPFAGSGSTGCGAILEGRRFIGIEQDPAYCAIARARLEYWARSRQYSLFE